MKKKLLNLLKNIWGIIKMSNKIKVKDIQKVIEKVFRQGYGDTIELKINGEYYEIEK
jgi:hypothetical protein